MAAKKSRCRPVVPSEGAKRRSRGIALVLAEWLAIETAAIPRLAALARNDPTSVTTKQFKYSVNDRFGSTRPQQSASRSAAFVSINVVYDIGFTRERPVLRQQLDVGRARPGTRQNAQYLKSFGTSSIPNPMSMILQQSDSLKLTRKQSDSLATVSTKFARYADSVWTPAAKILEAGGKFFIR